MTRILCAAALAMAVAGVAGCESSGVGGASGSMAPEQNQGTGLTSIDQPFVRDALQVAAFEMQASYMALERSDNEVVKKIAHQVIRDQRTAVSKLKEISKDHGEDFDASKTYEQDQSIARLKGLNGSDFDAEYLRQMSRTHRESIAEFLSESQYGKDEDVRSFTAQRIPQLEEQQRMIRGELTATGTASERDQKTLETRL